MSRHHHLYNDKRWKGTIGLRRLKLQSDPLCWYCRQLGQIVEATVVDHIVPHNGNEELFFDWGNLRSLCKSCHDRYAAVKDGTGYAPGVSVDGLPIDDGHPWGRE